MKTITFLCAACAGLSMNAQPSAVDTDTTATLLNPAIVRSALVERDAPLTLHTLPRTAIGLYGGGGTYPELLRNVSSVYATSDAGNYGDAKINIRGFRQDNISVLLNGLPLSGIRSGSLFWNNWLGLADATQTIQLQKGVGESMLASNALGGSINIITRPAQQQRGGHAAFSATDYGQFKADVSFATGRLPGGWSVAFTGSHTRGAGYVDATDVRSWAYFLTVGKVAGTRHSLVLNVMGAPEMHEQRSQKLSHAEVAARGLHYNKNWGYYRGTPKNISANTYHRPYFTLDWHFTPTQRFRLATTAYFSTGTGGGRWTETAGGTPIAAYRTADGQIDWQQMLDNNRTNDGASKNILSDYLAGNTGTGLLSTAHLTLNSHQTWRAGMHYQYFYSWQYEKITDLLGGDYWYENYAAQSLAGLAGRDPRKQTGDYIRLHNGANDHSLSLFTQWLHRSEQWNAFAGGLFMVNTYQRWDKYNYTANNAYSRTATAAGGNLKAGVARHLQGGRQLYLNGGIYSRVPYSGTYFSQNNNTLTGNVSNEWNFMSEAGYRVEQGNIRFNLNGYYAYWKNRTLLSNPYRLLDDEDIRYMIQGLDAQHLGIEFSYDQQFDTPTGLYALSLFGTWGRWQWKNDVSATVYDPYGGQPIDTLHVYADGLFVGDAPQTQFGAATTFRFFRTLECRLECRYNARMYANFDPAGRTDPNDRAQPYRLPEAAVANLFVHYSFSLDGLPLQVFFSCHNLFGTTYIERGDDGAAHNLDTFRGYWAYGRTAQVGVRIRR